MKSQSAEVLPTMSQSRGKVVCRYNYQKVEIGDDSGGATAAIDFDSVVIPAPVTRAALIDAIILERYDKSAEIALINNRGSKQGDIDYAEYQTFRAQAKAWADEILEGAN